MPAEQPIPPPVRYLSTRSDAAPLTFTEILLEGLAPDGGLYLPTHYPRLDPATLASWRGLSYAELAERVLALFIDDIPARDLHELVHGTYTAQVFGTEAITPLTPLPGVRGLQSAADQELALLELSNGPTLAFKDMAMQLLGALFEYQLRREGRPLNILGATSGDTGSAAEYAMRGREGIAVFMLSPHGRMSPFQQAQMFTLAEENIHNLAVEGVFDDCQDLVKAVSGDLDFKRRLNIGTVNSINWARLVAQVVYYVAGWLAATDPALDGRQGDDGEHAAPQQVSFTVPSGNFGNICAGHVARMMGLPIRRLVLATNENNVLEEFIRTGTYRVRGGADTYETSSPSMDISKASNIERFVFDLLGRDADRVADLFGRQVTEAGGFTITPEEHARIADEFGFVAGTSTHADRLATIAAVYAACGRLIDTHTADGVHVALEHLKDGVPMVVLETAQPIKFAAVVEQATGVRPPLPATVADLEDLPWQVEVVPPDLELIKRYLEKHALPH
ncbi:MAG: threonine synthase [Kineosporiaceae bacterium]|nr:threonine synthase [Kineosporiaceae bacterium]